MQNLSTFKDYLLFHLLPNYCSGELNEGGVLIGGGAINGENTVSKNLNQIILAIAVVGLQKPEKAILKQEINLN